MKSSFPLCSEPPFKPQKSKTHSEQFDVNNLDYNQVFNTAPLRSNVTPVPRNDHTMDVLEFFKHNSYTDSIYADEIANLLKEYSSDATVNSGDKRILDRLSMIKKHLS
jgi:hypothetical protein